MPVSQKQIAQVVGIDPSMVSHALRGDRRVAEATRLRVLHTASELGYHNGSNHEARSLAARRHGKRLETRIIGMVFDTVSVEDTWGAPAYRGMREKAQALNYDLLTLLRAPEDWMLDQQELLFLDQRTDGLVFVVPKGRQRVFETLVKHQIPAVSCFLDDVPDGIATIVLDDAGAMRQAVDYLVECGRRKILHVAGWKERSDFRARVGGYENAMRAAKLSPHCKYVEDENWLADVEELLLTRAVSAIVAAADGYALLVLQLMEKLGLSAPRDVSVIGMDDDPDAVHYGLTTFRYSSEEVGRCAVEAVTCMIAGETSRECSKVLPVEIVERSSVAPLKNKGDLP